MAVAVSMGLASTDFTYLALKRDAFGGITQSNGHYAAHGYSRSPILVPVERPYETFCSVSVSVSHSSFPMMISPCRPSGKTICHKTHQKTVANFTERLTTCVAATGDRSSICSNSVHLKVCILISSPANRLFSQPLTDHRRRHALGTLRNRVVAIKTVKVQFDIICNKT